MRQDPKIHPTWLYHPTLAPQGRIFQSPQETKGLWRQGWVDTPTKFPKPLRRGPRALIDRYGRLTFWNKIGFWGSLASLLSAGLYFLPASSTPLQNATVTSSQATIVQSGRDVIVNQAPGTRRLLPQQLRLLELVSQLQTKFAANRLIVSRAEGTLLFDDKRHSGAEDNLMRELFGEISPHNAGRLEELVQSMPQEYLRVVSEARWDNPFVLSITHEGVQYLAKE